ncbi:MAG: hypothetical protein CVV44_18715 [Spirochaetae bacterium HGW-Spirochaetae-1]|jgi:phosphoglycolate phosphatase|nr:MAG: hypothetical protein CVV44_18715 [Spirochaetae bacterium HGW-Spirochaetae-1]
MMYDSIIFDLDGTLWDALDVSAAAFTKGFREYGENITVTREELQKVTGLPADQCIEKMYPGITKRFPCIVRDFDRLERNAVEEKGGSIYPSVLQGIRILSEKYKIFIVSNCEDWYLNAFLHHSNVDGYIIDHGCYGRSGNTKTEMIDRLKEEYGLVRPVYVGDTQHDYLAAMGSGVDFIFAEYGFGEVDTDCRRVGDFLQLADILMVGP